MTTYAKGDRYYSYQKHMIFMGGAHAILFTKHHHGQSMNYYPVHVQLRIHIHTYKYEWKEPCGENNINNLEYFFYRDNI